MGWQDRDWARWTDAERARYLGTASAAGPARSRPRVGTRGAGATLLAMIASLAATGAVSHYHLPHSGYVARRSPKPAAPAPVVYGTGLSHFTGGSQELTCNAMARGASGVQSCTAWTVLLPGQHAVQAAPLPADPSCSAVEADQHSGRWVCTAHAAPPRSSYPGA